MSDKEISIDEIDRKLILELQNNGLYSSATLAQKLGISISTVSRRFRRLLEEDLIKVTAVPNPKKLGYDTLAIIALNVEMTGIDDVCKILVAHPAIHFVGLSLGRFDVLIVTHFRSSEELVEFIKNRLSRIDDVQRIETFYIAELKKRTFGWLAKEENEHLNSLQKQVSDPR